MITDILLNSIKYSQNDYAVKKHFKVLTYVQQTNSDVTFKLFYTLSFYSELIYGITVDATLYGFGPKLTL